MKQRVENSRSAIWATLAASLAVVCGCGPISNDEVRERYGIESKTPDAPSNELNVAGIEATPGFEDRIGNGSFERKDETGRPRGWAVNPAEIIVREQSPAVYPFDKEEYMTLRSVENSFGILAYSIDLPAEDLGKTVVATAQGRAPLWRYMFLTVRYKVDGEYIENLHEWPACPNEWTENIARERIPLEADPESVQVRILIRDDPGYTFCVDHVRAFVVD